MSTELTEMSQKRDSMEKELKDALSVEREAVKDLQREVERLKVISVHTYHMYDTRVQYCMHTNFSIRFVIFAAKYVHVYACNPIRTQI